MVKNIKFESDSLPPNLIMELSKDLQYEWESDDCMVFKKDDKKVGKLSLTEDTIKMTGKKLEEVATPTIKKIEEAKKWSEAKKNKCLFKEPDSGNFMSLFENKTLTHELSEELKSCGIEKIEFRPTFERMAETIYKKPTLLINSNVEGSDVGEQNTVVMSAVNGLMEKYGLQEISSYNEGSKIITPLQDEKPKDLKLKNIVVGRYYPMRNIIQMFFNPFGSVSFHSYKKEKGIIFALNLDGEIKWEIEGEYLWGLSIALGEGETLYAGGKNTLTAIDPDGKVKWVYKNKEYRHYFFPSVGEDGDIYISSTKTLIALNSMGKEKWVLNCDDYKLSKPVIGKNDRIYITTFHGKLYSINNKGKIMWTFETTGEPAALPVIGADGTVYFGSRDKNLYAVTQNGKKRWTFKTEGRIETSPAVGADGTIFFTAWLTELYAINPDGSLKWIYDSSYSFVSSPLIQNDGTLYCGTKYLISIKTDCGGPAKSAWSMFGKNSQRTFGK